MHTTVSMEAGFFLASATAGIIIAFLYDLLRLSRRIIGAGDAVVTIEDIVFMAAAAFLIFYAAYRKNNGELRWQSFIGGGLGIGAYILVVRNRFLNLSTFLIKWLIFLLEKAIKILFFPIRLLFMAFRKPISIIIWYTGLGVRRARRLIKRSGDRMSLHLKNTCNILRKK